MKKIVTGFLLGFGFFVCGMTAVTWLNPDTPPDDREESLAALMLFGVPSTAAGSWRVWSAIRRHRQAESDRLRSVFYRLIKAGDGKISVLAFAMEAQIPGKAAQAYLTERAQEFQADFDVSESGTIAYCFDLGGSHFSLLEAAQVSYDVVITAFPAYQKRHVSRLVQKLSGENWATVKARVETLPIPVRRKVDRETAEAMQTELQAIGAEVWIVVSE